MKRMTIREFLSQELSKDVYIEGLDDYAEAFEGPIRLTAEGEKKFGEFLDYLVDVDEEEPMAWVNIPEEKDLEEEGERVNRFFQIVAGDVSDKCWNKWFYFPEVFKFPENNKKEDTKMTEKNIAKKEKAIELMKRLDIYKPYIEGFRESDKVCLFEGFGGYWADQEPEVYDKMKAIEKKYGCLVYAVTHEFTEFGECYSFLIVTAYPEDWDTLVHSQGNRHAAFAYVWNKDDDWCSEFGDVAVQSFGGGIKRIV